MADYVIDKLPNRALPITRDCDTRFSVERADDDAEPVDWDGELYLLLDIDKADPTQIDATVTGAVADFVIESEVGNLCRNGMTWRVVLVEDAEPTYQRPIVVGTVERNDGL